MSTLRTETTERGIERERWGRRKRGRMVDFSSSHRVSGLNIPFRIRLTLYNEYFFLEERQFFPVKNRLLKVLILLRF